MMNTLLEPRSMNGDAKICDVPPKFRRRVGLASKGNLRAKNEPLCQSQENDVAELKTDDSDDDKGINKRTLEDLKVIHTMKIQREGISTDVLNHVEHKGKRAGSTNVNSSNSSFAAQFDSRMDHGLQTTVPHEKIMDEFINEKLGLSQYSDVAKVNSNRSELHNVPDELKFTCVDSISKKVKLDDEGVVSSWSTGIAEIQLPLSYKLQNIQETKQAANSGLRYYNSLNGKSGGFQRFQINDSNLFTSATADTHSQEFDNTINRKPLRSTDDLAVQRFKKQLSNNRR